MTSVELLARRSGDPFKGEIYFDRAERVMDRQWRHFIWPRIHDADFRAVVEIACGHGRNTAKLAALADRITAVDINEECIEYVRARFAAQPKIAVVRNDGASLAGIATGSATFVYCWDAMVHFEPEVVAAYVPEIARVLAPGGRGFIHHSNWSGGRGQNFQAQPHWRNFMTREMFSSCLRACGLEILSQDLVDWDASTPWWKTLWGLRASKRPVTALDCISLFQKPPACAAQIG